MHKFCSNIEIEDCWERDCGTEGLRSRGAEEVGVVWRLFWAICCICFHFISYLFQFFAHSFATCVDVAHFLAMLFLLISFFDFFSPLGCNFKILHTLLVSSVQREPSQVRGIHLYFMCDVFVLIAIAIAIAIDLSDCNKLLPSLTGPMDQRLWTSL